MIPMLLTSFAFILSIAFEKSFEGKGEQTSDNVLDQTGSIQLALIGSD